MKRFRRGPAITGVLFVVLLSVGIYGRIRATGEAEGESAGGDTGPTPASAASAFTTDIAIPVEGVAARRGTLVLSVSAAGQAAAWRQAVVTAQVNGRVAAVPARENGAVGESSPLVVLDPVEYQLAVDEAEARLRTAQAQFEELTLLNEEIADPATRAERERFARARSGLDEAGVGLRRAQLDLARTRLGAPFAGRAASIEVVPGEWVRTGDELMTVLDLDPIRVEVQVLESEVGLLGAGGRASVSFAAFPDEAFAGRVETINPMVEPGTRTARVTVLVPNPQGRILPGMYARVSLDARRYADRILVPRSAVLERDRRSMLFVYQGDDRGGLAKWRYVTTGLANDSLVEIVPGDGTELVEPGETVLTDGHYTLIHDARVRVVEDVAAQGGRPQ
jgi:membrane fusion protein (multidrug efflux system)